MQKPLTSVRGAGWALSRVPGRRAPCPQGRAGSSGPRLRERGCDPLTAEAGALCKCVRTEGRPPGPTSLSLRKGPAHVWPDRHCPQIAGPSPGAGHRWRTPSEVGGEVGAGGRGGSGPGGRGRVRARDAGPGRRAEAWPALPLCIPEPHPSPGLTAPATWLSPPPDSAAAPPARRQAHLPLQACALSSGLRRVGRE